MSIKIKFSFNELRRRAAKLLDIPLVDIDSVCPSEGGTKFYVAYSKRINYRTQTQVATFTVWQFVHALPVEDAIGSIEGFWDKGLDSVLSVLGLNKLPNTEKEIKIAYRKQAKIHHPDTGGDPNKFREVQTAYEFALSLLPELRKVQA